MTINCSDGTYTIYYTNIELDPISVDKYTLITDVLDISLVGRLRKNFGTPVNENFLHLLENFAAPQKTPTSLLYGEPDTSQTYSSLLEYPTIGQRWFNTSIQRLYIYNGTNWVQTGSPDDVGGNSGIIADGESIPLPISNITNIAFDISECYMFVSPFNYPDQTQNFNCYVNGDGVVTSTYQLIDSEDQVSGFANYQVMAIRNIGITPTPTPSVTQSITPTISVTPSVSPTPSVTPTLSVTPTPSTQPSYTILPFTNNTYTSTAAYFQSGSNWVASSALVLTFATDGTYSVISTVNGTSQTLYSDTWLPVGESVDNYNITMGYVTYTNSSGTNGNATITNSASSSSAMTSSQSVTLNTGFVYAGTGVPNSITGGNLSIDTTVQLVNSSTGTIIAGNIFMLASSGPT